MGLISGQLPIKTKQQNKMKKNKKQYPMDGPTLETQRLMQSPRENHERLRKILLAKGSTITREETLAILDLQ